MRSAHDHGPRTRGRKEGRGRVRRLRGLKNSLTTNRGAAPRALKQDNNQSSVSPPGAAHAPPFLKTPLPQKTHSAFMKTIFFTLGSHLWWSSVVGFPPAVVMLTEHIPSSYLLRQPVRVSICFGAWSLRIPKASVLSRIYTHTTENKMKSKLITPS